MDAAIQKALTSDADDAVTNYYAEYLESETFPADAASVALRHYIWGKFAGRQIDLVIANTSPSLEFAIQNRAELFPNAPIVFAAGSVPETIVGRTVPGVTGIVTDVAFAETLQLALSVHPSVKRVFVIAEAPEAEGYHERVLEALQPFSEQVAIVSLRAKSVASLLSSVQAVPAGSLIFYTRYQPFDDAERAPYTDEIARRLAEVAPVPIYSPTDLYIGTGVLGGMMRSHQLTGARIGAIARRIIDGTAADAIPIENVRVAPTFDWRQVRRWGLDPSRLPPESDIRFRVPTVWETYRAYIVGTIAIVTAQLLLITGLLTQVARRRRAEETILTRETSLRTSYEQIRQLAGSLINAQDAARAAIAQDLHDDVCQRLVYVTLAVSSLKSSSGNIEDLDAQKALSELERDTQGVFDGIRKLSHDLHPATLRVLGLAPALKAHCVDVEKRQNVHVTFTVHGDLGHVHPDVAVCFFRIAQEAIRNAIVHGEARRLRVSIDRSGENLELTVADDGGGFDLEAVRRTGGGLGLVTMEERARVVGAETRIAAAPGRGTTIRVRGPAEPPQPVRLAHAGLGSRSGSAREAPPTEVAPVRSADR
jgi:signal transduction histidine kinase